MADAAARERALQEAKDQAAARAAAEQLRQDQITAARQRAEAVRATQEER